MTLAVGSDQIGGMRPKLRQPTRANPPSQLLDRRLLDVSLGLPEEVLGQRPPFLGGTCVELAMQLGRYVWDQGLRRVAHLVACALHVRFSHAVCDLADSR